MKAILSPRVFFGLCGQDFIEKITTETRLTEFQFMIMLSAYAISRAVRSTIEAAGGLRFKQRCHLHRLLFGDSRCVAVPLATPQAHQILP